MSWFKRSKEGITTATSDKKEVPEGLWYAVQIVKHYLPVMIWLKIITCVIAVHIMNELVRKNISN